MIMLATLASFALVASKGGVSDNSTAWRSEILAAHNKERAQVGTPPLVWSDDLARDAAAYAEELAETHSFSHDPDNFSQGENLWAGTRGAYSARDMVESWADEKAAAMRSDRWWEATSHTGHFVQIIWRTTRAVGCAVSSNGSEDVLVCRYYPAGNVVGQNPYTGRTR